MAAPYLTDQMGMPPGAALGRGRAPGKVQSLGTWGWPRKARRSDSGGQWRLGHRRHCVAARVRALCPYLSLSGMMESSSILVRASEQGVSLSGWAGKMQRLAGLGLTSSSKKNSSAGGQARAC